MEGAAVSSPPLSHLQQPSPVLDQSAALLITPPVMVCPDLGQRCSSLTSSCICRPWREPLTQMLTSALDPPWTSGSAPAPEVLLDLQTSAGMSSGPLLPTPRKDLKTFSNN